MEIRIHGAHQLALRRKSVKVFEGAMNVLTMRAPSESGAGSGVGAGVAGRTGAAAMNPPDEDRRNSSRRRAAIQAVRLRAAGANRCNENPPCATIKLTKPG